MMRGWQRGLVGVGAVAVVVAGVLLASRPWTDGETHVQEAAAGTIEHRLCDVVVEAPLTAPVPGQERLVVGRRVSVESYEPTVELQPMFRLQIRGAIDSTIDSTVLIDPITGEVLEERYETPSQEATLQGLLQTLRVEQLDPATAPWPYTDTSQAPAKRAKHGIFEYRLPDPASGLVASQIVGDTWDPVTKIGGAEHAFILANCRSVEMISFSPFTGEELWRMRDVHPDDEAAFQVFLDELDIVVGLEQ